MSLPALSRKDALRALDLDGAPPDCDVSRAFRQKAKALNLAHGGPRADMEDALRRLIEARERLLADMVHPYGRHAPSPPPAPAPIAPLSISLDVAVRGGVITRQLADEALPFVEQIRPQSQLRLLLPPGLRPDEVVSLIPDGATTARHFCIRIEAGPLGCAFGDDIWMEARVDPTLMRQGANVSIETVHGPLRIAVPSGCEPGSCLTIPGRGLPHTKTRGAGKLFIRLEADSGLNLAYDRISEAFRRRWVSSQA